MNDSAAVRGKLIDRLTALARARLGETRAPAVANFLAGYYANLAVEDLTQSDEELYGAALALWQFGRVRPAGTAKVRVTNPKLATHGWASPHTVVEIVNDDMPFLVDSVIGELTSRELTVHRLAHPIIKVTRDGAGNATACGAGAPESFMQIEIDQLADGACADLEAKLAAVLADVRAAVGDWQAMRARMTAVRAPLESASGDAAATGRFLAWLSDNNFTFLGYRRYAFAGGEAPQISVEAGSGLGLLRDDAVIVLDGMRDMANLPPDVRAFIRDPVPLLIAKSSRRSTVHRAVPLDVIGVKTVVDGRVAGMDLFVGLYTSAAYNQSPRGIPLLDHKVAQVIERAGFAPASHDGKSLTHILETYPRDELFQASTDELYDTAIGILRLKERQRSALFVRKDAFERFVSALVYVPRDRYSTDLRRRIQALLAEAYGGTIARWDSQFAEDTLLMRIHFIIATTPGAIPAVDVGDLAHRIADLARAFADRLRESLVAARGEESGLKLLRRYAEAFPAGYRERFTADNAVADVGQIEAVLADPAALAIDLYRPVDALDNELRLRIFHQGAPVALSDILPMLENLGLRVMTEQPYEIAPAGQPPVWMHDFSMLTQVAAPDLTRIKAKFEAALAAIWSGAAGSDGLNRLVLGAGLDMRSVTVLRAYARYLRQIGLAYSQSYVEDALANNPKIAARLIDLFKTLHDPALKGDRDTAARGLAVEIDHLLDGVTNLDQDRILRRFLNLVKVTVRTNFFRDRPYLSFKLDSQNIDDLPLPRPLVEVWVYAQNVEAIHLRGGRVARGGIRWTDRPEDFRTEILGLMKAQMVKNAVIVPVGSKGGFFPKRGPGPDAGRDAIQAHAIESYKTLMRGLLDVTDSIAPDGIVAPKDVVRRDGDDPYLVVAADKGTATFSDIANGVSRDYGFWLDDAFASGGSAGYDHKAMGITARGAWEAVMRHFREIGIDTQSQEFTCVGVGDMSGDVFGNGLLRTPHVKLLAAFDHRHIFVDPAPDPAKAFAERARMFKLPRSSWADYDGKLISPGGGVFDRKAKSIKTTPEIRALFGIGETVTPADLIKAILKAPVDLLWLGGIGTYVKAASETNAEAGDRANDGLRIDGKDLRCKVVGEGANLGFTQRGRVEFARAGGRINTDAIDNSAGVDTSDHEVNIKILLGDVIARGDMTLKQRDLLLARMTDDVAAHVLGHNYHQTQALSVMEAEGVQGLEPSLRMIRALEKAGRLNRAIEFLPDDEEFAKRQAAKAGLTRPELAVLLAYAKLTLYDGLLASDLPGEAALEDTLVKYFPRELRETQRAAILRHRLKREITATMLTNDLVNRAGTNFVNDLRERLGCDPAEIARGYHVARAIFDLPRLWVAIEALDNKVPAAAQTRMLALTQGLLRRVVPALIAHAPVGADGVRKLDMAAAIERLRAPIAALLASAPATLSDARLEEIKPLTDAGVPGDLARTLAALDDLAAAPAIVDLASATGGQPDTVAATYFAIGDRLRFDWLARRASRAGQGGIWARRAADALIDDLEGLQAQAARAVLSTGGDGDRLATWLEMRKADLARYDALIGELRAVAMPDLAGLTVAARALRALVG